MSTSSVGREEERKPLLDAYMFERRLLFGCTVLVGVALIFWIVAVSTDHWFIISGEGGIYIPRTNRYFMSSHSGLWRICRYSKNPVPRVNLTAALNITTLSFINSQVLQNAKLEISQLPYIQDFLNPNLTLPLDPHAALLQHPVFNETSKRQMFAYWVSGETVEFGKYKKAYHDTRNPSPKVNGKVLEVNSTHIGLVHTLYQDLVVNLTTNGTNMYYVLPRGLKEVLFDGWTEKPRIPRLLLAYARDLEIPLIVPDETGTILQLVPPKPPKRGRMQNGLEYISVPACRYIDMFPTENTIRNDPTIDNAVLDYIRTQASFACIAVIVMAMGCFFSIYTFLNPRYMFKRLASGIHFISAALTLVVIQVLIASVDYKEENLSYSYPAGAEREYGYGTYIAWLVFACNLFAGVMFMWYSGKKKGNKAATDELAMADEAVNIGR